MSYSIDLTFPRKHVALITFADAARQNQLCWAAVDELAARLRESRESGARVVVLASGLEGHWLEHAWLHDLSAGIEGIEQTGQGLGWFTVQQELTDERMVSIAAISGSCSGGGAEFGWACDLRVAEQQAYFSQPEVSMGLTTGIGGCSRLVRLAGRAATAEMVLTGQPLSARRLNELGAINRVVATGGALDAAMELADRLAGKSPEAISALKRILNESGEMTLAESLQFEQATFQSVVASDDARAGMRAVQAAYDAGDSIDQANGFNLPE